MTHPEPLPGLPFAQVGMVRSGASAEVYHGFGQDGRPVTIAVLTPAGAADPAVRAAFLDLAGRNSFPVSPGQAPVHAADLAAARPWAANYQLPDHVGVEAWPDLLPPPASAPLTPGTDPTSPADLAPAPEGPPSDSSQSTGSDAAPSDPPEPIGSEAVPSDSSQPIGPEAVPSDSSQPIGPEAVSWDPSQPIGSDAVPWGPPQPAAQPAPWGPPQPGASQAVPWGPPQPGAPQAVPWGPPQPGAPQPAARSDKNPLIVIIAGICAVAVLLTAAVVVAVRAYDRRRPVASPSGPPPASRSADLGGFPSAGPTASAGGGPGDPGGVEPTLRQVPARTVVGPTYAAGDKTYTMAFKGWPFAFRTAEAWGCLAGKAPDKLADAKVWVCVDERNAGARQKANILLRPCPTTCTSAERTSLNAQWFDEPAKAKPVLDNRTSFVETERNDKGFYSVDLSHFIGDTPGGPLKWQVGVFVQSPPETRGVVQKLLNDVVTQAG